MPTRYVPKGLKKQFWFSVLWPNGVERFVQARDARAALKKSRRGAIYAFKIGRFTVTQPGDKKRLVAFRIS